MQLPGFSTKNVSVRITALGLQSKVVLTNEEARILRTVLEAGAATGQLSLGGKEVLTFQEASLPEAGLSWGIVSPQDTAILFLFG